MIKVFLHISVHIGTHQAQLAGRKEAELGPDSPGGLTVPSTEPVEGRKACAPLRPQGLCPNPNFTDGKIGLEREICLKAS